MNKENLLKYLDKISGIEIKLNENLKSKTTFRIGGPAKIFLEISNIEALSKAVKILNEQSVEYFILGGGSNLLVNSNGVNNIVIISLKDEFKKVNITNKNSFLEIEVGASHSLASISKLALENCASGLEFGIAIPGSVGGGVIMNAGAHGSEIKDVVTKIQIVTKNGEIKELTNAEANFSYRKSGLGDYIITKAWFNLKNSEKQKIKNLMNENLEYRAKTQPKGFSAGSIFKNPNGYKSWFLIREVGLAGYRIGDAIISEKHTNFIINLGKATSYDVLKLIELAKNRVFNKFSIELELEIKLLELKL